MSDRKLFWLHVKKAGGTTIRKLLQPHYVLTDRVNRPKTFLQAQPEEYNDILNNFRVVLGEYQFKRSLFAKTYLYDDWASMYSFAFSRHPIDRCLSSFYYLFYGYSNSLSARVGFFLKSAISNKKLVASRKYAFDLFLDLIVECRESPSSFQPMGLHFSTHTASMWGDVTDRSGQVLLSRIFRLNDLQAGINEAFHQCNLPLLDQPIVSLNGGNYSSFEISPAQRSKIVALYCADFDIYEDAKYLD